MPRVRDIQLRCSPPLIALFLPRIEGNRRAENYLAAIVASGSIERRKRRSELRYVLPGNQASLRHNHTLPLPKAIHRFPPENFHDIAPTP